MVFERIKNVYTSKTRVNPNYYTGNGKRKRYKKKVGKFFKRLGATSKYIENYKW